MTENDAPPNEFMDFVRKIGVGAFDRFANHLTDRTDALGKLATQWKALETADKERFFDQLVAGGVIVAAAAGPAVAAMARKVRKSAEPNKKEKKEKKEKKSKKEKKDKKAKKKKAKEE